MLFRGCSQPQIQPADHRRATPYIVAYVVIALWVVNPRTMSGSRTFGTEVHLNLIYPFGLRAVIEAFTYYELFICGQTACIASLILHDA